MAEALVVPERPLHCGMNFVPATSKHLLKHLQQQHSPVEWGMNHWIGLYIAITLPAEDTNHFFYCLSSTKWWKITWNLWSVSLWSMWFQATPSSFGCHYLILMLLKEIFVMECSLFMFQGLNLFQALLASNCGSLMSYTYCWHDGLGMHEVRKSSGQISQQLL